MKILCLPKEMSNLRNRPKGAKWINITVTPVSLKNLLDRHHLRTPEALIMKLWVDFKLTTETFDRIRIKIKKGDTNGT